MCRHNMERLQQWDKNMNMQCLSQQYLLLSVTGACRNENPRENISPQQLRALHFLPRQFIWAGSGKMWCATNILLPPGKSPKILSGSPLLCFVGQEQQRSDEVREETLSDLFASTFGIPLQKPSKRFQAFAVVYFQFP